MAEITFPVSPADADQYTFNGVTYQYEAASNKWKVIQRPLFLGEANITSAQSAIDFSGMPLSEYRKIEFDVLGLAADDSSGVTHTYTVNISDDGGSTFKSDWYGSDRLLISEPLSGLQSFSGADAYIAKSSRNFAETFFGIEYGLSGKLIITENQFITQGMRYQYDNRIEAYFSAGAMNGYSPDFYRFVHETEDFVHGKIIAWGYK